MVIHVMHVLYPAAMRMSCFGIGERLNNNIKFKAYVTFKASSDVASLGWTFPMIHRMV